MKIPKARKLPSGTWHIQLRLGGESITVNARTEKECVRQAQIIKAEYLAGKRAAPVDTAQLPTLRQAIDAYIDSRTNTLSPATLRGYDIVKRNRFKVVPQERVFLDATEIQIFRAAVRGNRYEIPFLLALSSLRMSELMALRWEDVDLKHKRIRVAGAAVPGRDHKMVHKKETKNRTSNRYVPILMDQLQKALEAAQKPSGLVSPTLRTETLRQALARICAANKLPPVTMHGLRHSFASLAYHLQVPEQVTMEIGGWSDYGTMRRIYTHIAQADMQRYEDAFSGFFSEKNAHANAHEQNTPLRQ